MRNMSQAVTSAILGALISAIIIACLMMLSGCGEEDKLTIVQINTSDSAPAITDGYYLWWLNGVYFFTETLVEGEVYNLELVIEDVDKNVDTVYLQDVYEDGRTSEILTVNLEVPNYDTTFYMSFPEPFVMIAVPQGNWYTRCYAVDTDGNESAEFDINYITSAVK